jgi:hypothetical protein|tara:strand:+ start:48 stop:317 length:270 start_codon:yes stop_codon:yes gene_type:complete
MSNDNLESERQRGERARLLLDDPLFKEAFELLKKEYQSAMFQTKHSEDNERKALWQAYHITAKVENHFITVMETGKLATVQINQLKQNS